MSPGVVVGIVQVGIGIGSSGSGSSGGGGSSNSGGSSCCGGGGGSGTCGIISESSPWVRCRIDRLKGCEGRVGGRR